MKLYAALLFLPLLVIGVCYFLIMFPISLPIGIYLTTAGVLNKEDWETYDTRIINKTKSPLKRFFLSCWTNRREPIPSGGRKYLWNDKAPWYRYFRWHIRNPISDMNHFYVGFYQRTYKKIVLWKTSWFECNLKKIENCPFYFPRYVIKFPFGFEFSLGWKTRGCFSIHFKR